MQHVICTINGNLGRAGMNWDGLGLNEFDLFIEFDMPSATRIVWSHPARSFYSGPEAC